MIMCQEGGNGIVIKKRSSFGGKICQVTAWADTAQGKPGLNLKRKRRGKKRGDGY